VAKLPMIDFGGASPVFPQDIAIQKRHRVHFQKSDQVTVEVDPHLEPEAKKVEQVQDNISKIEP
jgi:hypothetical protein